MADGTGPDEAAEDDPVVSLDASLERMDPEGIEDLLTDIINDDIDYVVRAPIAAVRAGIRVGERELTSIFVVCDDGACYKRGHSSPEWLEVEPIPGTVRAGQLEAESVCGVLREGAEDQTEGCTRLPGHKPPHIDSNSFRWE